MELFICWSGERSHELAHKLNTWLPKILLDIEPFVSDKIEKGELWFPKVREKLQSASAGLICLTRESLGSPWIHYEAGVLAQAVSTQKGVDKVSGRIFTYLLDVDPTEVQGPLAAYQSTVATREDTRLLIAALAKTLSLSADWNSRFEKIWPRFENDLKSIKRLWLRDVFAGFEDLFQRKTFEEPLAHCTGQRWCQRVAGALQTKLLLQQQKQTVDSACRKYVGVLYEQLLGELDGYEMDMSSLLLQEKRFDISAEGVLAIEPRGIAKACERRRLGIKKLVNILSDQRQAPVLDESCVFARLETFEEKKNLIHRIESRLDALAKSNSLKGAKDSDWELDRISWYLLQDWFIEKGRTAKAVSIADAVDSIRIEIEKAGAKEKGEIPISLMLLHYSLAPVNAWLKYYENHSKETLQDQDLIRIEDVLKKIKEFLGERKDQVKEGKLRLTIGDTQQFIDKLRDRQSNSRLDDRAAVQR